MLRFKRNSFAKISSHKAITLHLGEDYDIEIIQMLLKTKYNTK